MNGIITDIQRFSLNDGPGIRTTVFLKGCPLACQWCHNPETQSFLPELRFRRSQCNLCGACEKDCPIHQVSAHDHQIDFDRCQNCGQCAACCPTSALSLFGRSASAEEIMAEVLRDQDYYSHSSGGLTLSGGEPFSQGVFTLALLQKAKEAGLHTCLETSLYTDAKIIQSILPFTDLFLVDWKLGDSALHQRYTGVGHARILKNIRFLDCHHAAIILRCPIIPGINAFPWHFDSIAQLANTTAAIQSVELMAYHTTGESKYRQTGREYQLSALHEFSADQKDSILRQVSALCQKPVKWG